VADASKGRDASLEVVIQKVRGDKVLVEVLVWGLAARKRWVRFTELREVGWQ
jgi:hypothetical protein